MAVGPVPAKTTGGGLDGGVRWRRVLAGLLLAWLAVVESAAQKNPNSLCKEEPQDYPTEKRIKKSLPVGTDGRRCSYIANIMKSKIMTHLCTGVLYSHNAVVVPATCVAEGCGTSDYEPNPIVGVGSSAIDPDKEQDKIEVRETLHKMVHPGFGRSGTGTCLNDIAILILNQNVTTKPAIVTSSPCEFMDAVGWFKMGPEGKSGNWPPLLQCVPDMKIEECMNKHTAVGSSEGLLCAFAEEKTLCEWDRGAVLLCASEGGEALTGLASYFPEQCDVEPYGYMNISYYKQWIDAELERHRNDEGSNSENHETCGDGKRQ